MGRIMPRSRHGVMRPLAPATKSAFILEALLVITLLCA